MADECLILAEHVMRLQCGVCVLKQTMRFSITICCIR
ncbi:hypothetical protein V6Z11_D10G287000 [Gossypium hirsutum]